MRGKTSLGNLGKEHPGGFPNSINISIFFADSGGKGQQRHAKWANLARSLSREAKHSTFSLVLRAAWVFFCSDVSQIGSLLHSFSNLDRRSRSDGKCYWLEFLRRAIQPPFGKWLARSVCRLFLTFQPLQQGLITGLYDVGCLVGSIAIFLVGENLGRRKSIVSISNRYS